MRKKVSVIKKIGVTANIKLIKVLTSINEVKVSLIIKDITGSFKGLIGGNKYIKGF